MRSNTHSKKKFPGIFLIAYVNLLSPVDNIVMNISKCIFNLKTKYMFTKWFLIELIRKLCLSLKFDFDDDIFQGKSESTGDFGILRKIGLMLTLGMFLLSIEHFHAFLQMSS